jgi:leader peptidase (prepilin peptidase)/N-methyltransferase
VVAAIDDARTHRLQNRYTGALALVAVVGFASAAASGRTGLPVGSLLAGAAIFTAPWLAAWLASPAGIGFGDIKLGAGLGLYLGWLGPEVAFTGLIATTALAGLGALVALATGHRDSLQPLGPAMVGGAVTATALATLMG